MLNFDRNPVALQFWLQFFWLNPAVCSLRSALLGGPPKTQDDGITSRGKNVQRFLSLNVQKLRLKWEICFCNKTSKTVAREVVFGVNNLNPSRNHPMIWFLENVQFLRLTGDFLHIIVVPLLIKESTWEQMFCSKGLLIGLMKLR